MFCEASPYLFSWSFDRSGKKWTLKTNPLEAVNQGVLLKGFPRNFIKLTGKHMSQSLRPTTLLKKRLWHRHFPVNFVKFLRTHVFHRTPLVAASDPISKTSAFFYPANISTLFQRCLLVDATSRRGTISNQRWNNVVYFNVDMNNVRQRRNNVVIFNVEFYNVGKRRNNVVKMTASKKHKKN